MKYSSSSRDKNVFMKKFKVGYSNNGSDFTMVKEDNSSKPKVREGTWEFMFGILCIHLLSFQRRPTDQ